MEGSCSTESLAEEILCGAGEIEPDARAPSERADARRLADVGEEPSRHSPPALRQGSDYKGNLKPADSSK